jgi:hypothetical protein
MIIGWLKEGCSLKLHGMAVFMLARLDYGAIYSGWELELWVEPSCEESCEAGMNCYLK